MIDLIGLPSTDVRDGYASGEFTPVDVMEQLLDHIATIDDTINSLAMLDTDGALAAAAESRERWSSGIPIGPLDGLPVSMKDSIACLGTPWRHGSAPNAELPYSTLDSPPAARLREAGAVIFGKTTMPDFGMLAAGVSSLYGVTRNPWDTSKNPGGSSSGAGAGLSAGIGWGAVGTDIAGSVRLPAAHCGLVGFKPTQGRIPHTSPSSMRSAGPLARSVPELWDLYRELVKPDRRDNLSLAPERPISQYSALDSVEGLRVGVLCDMGYGMEAVDEVRKVVDRAALKLSMAGAAVVRVAAPFTGDPYAALDRVFQVRSYHELMELPANKRDLVLPGLVQWSMEAATFDARSYQTDLVSVLKNQEKLRAHLASFDVVISPVLPEISFPADHLGMDETHPLAHCSFTAWFNQTGQPAASLSFGKSEGMPVGVQIVGQKFADLDVLRVAGWLEARRGYEMKWPVRPRVQHGVEVEGTAMRH